MLLNDELLGLPLNGGRGLIFWQNTARETILLLVPAMTGFSGVA